MLMVAVGLVMLVVVVRVFCIGVVGVVGVLCIGAVEVDCARVVDILVLGGVFVVEMVEGVELVVGCVFRLVLWCADRRGYFLCHFSLILVEMNGLSVGGCLFGMVIRVDCFSFWNVVSWARWQVWKCWFWWRLWMWCKEGFFVFFRCDCLGNMMGVRVMIEVVVGVLVLVWWRWSVV